MELDIDGTGKPRLYQFLTAGAQYTLLNFYEADMAPYAIFEVDPEPHAFFGTSLVDLGDARSRRGHIYAARCFGQRCVDK